MTPLAATSSPTPPTPAPGARADKSAARSGDDTAFAQALERRQGVRAGGDATRARASGDNSDTSTAGAAPESAPAPGAGARPDQDSIEPATPALVDVQQPAPVWPPAGLAALLGFPADVAADAAPAADGAEPDADVRPLPLAGALQAATTPMAPAAITLPAAVLPDAEPDVALPMPALAVDSAAPVDGGDPAPVAFTLPATAALREPAPILAAPWPTPNVGAVYFVARFGAQLDWMADHKIAHARIRVTPHDLGPVEVRLHMDGDKIRAEFVSAQAETRQALEQGLPRLRDLLGESGFQLAHAGVGSGQGGRDGDPSSAARAGIAEAGDGAQVGQDAAPPVRRTIVGLLDAYA